jgi:uncharacterized protein (DUF2384 family)
MPTSIKERDIAVMKDVPSQINDSEILNYLQNKEINWKYIELLKRLTSFNYEQISHFLSISMRTLQTYSTRAGKLKENTQEHVLLLLTLIKHGEFVFGTVESFDSWLSSENLFFDGKSPAAFLNSATGIRFVDSRLTAMEHGDNI